VVGNTLFVEPGFGIRKRCALAVNRVSRATLTTQLEDALRLDIIEGVLAPGQRLRSAELTDRYQVSATPLREALQRLAAQNLVEIDPRFGATVARISRSDLRDTYWLREVLETLALKRSIHAGDDAWRTRVTEAFEAFTAAHGAPPAEDTLEIAMDWSTLHRRFHEELFSACDSLWLRRMLTTLYDHSERYRMVSRSRGTRDTYAEHKGMYEPAVAGDVKAATAALAAHLRGTVELLESALPQDGEEAETEGQ
jgi:GntR family transcriptional regulator, carbon starvation induced regulator